MEAVSPKFFDRDYKTEHVSNHVAKFRGDRLTNLVDLALKKIKTRRRSQECISPPSEVTKTLRLLLLHLQLQLKIMGSQP